MADSVVQQVIGHGIAARLSARLGEGMVNGLLTARLVFLTIDMVRLLLCSTTCCGRADVLARYLLWLGAEAEGPSCKLGRWNARYRAKGQ